MDAFLKLFKKLKYYLLRIILLLTAIAISMLVFLFIANTFTKMGETVLKAMSGQNETASSVPVFMERREIVLKAMKAGHKFSQTLLHGFQKTGKFLAEKTGAKTVLEHLKTVKKLFQLSEEDKIWLVHTTPALRKLVNNPSLIAVIEDEKLMALIEEVSEGSLKALYQLKEEPLIKNLFDDKELVEAIKQIQLKELLRKVKNRVSSSKLKIYRPLVIVNS